MMADELYDLGTLNGLVATLLQKPDKLLTYQGRPFLTPSDGAFYCASCGRTCRMSIEPHYFSRCYGREPKLNTRDHSEVKQLLAPAVLMYQCVQCRSVFTATIFTGPNGPELAVHAGKHGGLSTPHTPVGATYYLDQAQRAESAGARSAAMAMYRGALEHVLFDQGYKMRMAGRKIEALEKDMKAGKAPLWARVDPEFLKVIKSLADFAVHPNDGDIAKQNEIDSHLLAAVRKAFEEILLQVYEEPGRQAASKASMKAALAAMSGDAASKEK